MAEKKTPPDDSPAGAPLYMVSFGDMMTILLTFFILLCSYSKERQAGFISDGVGSFKNVVNAMGLPGVLPGDKYPVDLGASRARYRPAGALNDQFLTDAEGRVSELNRDALRKVVKKALTRTRMSKLPITLIYDRRETALTEDHRRLFDVVADLLRGHNMVLRIDGYAYEEGVDARATQEIAVVRAAAVADYLEEALGIDRKDMRVTGFGSGGAGAERAAVRRVQDRLGRRIVLIYVLPKED